MQRKEARRMVRLGAYECEYCGVRSHGWQLDGVFGGRVWARCPRCGAEQVVGRV